MLNLAKMNVQFYEPWRNALKYIVADKKDVNTVKDEILGNINYLNKIAGDLLSSFEKHYEDSLTSKTYQELWSAEMDVHQEIKKIKNELLKL